MEHELAKFVEDVALYWEKQGIPRIAGRIIGLLLVCEPPHRSAQELVEELKASKASVSTMTRLLVEAGSIEVVAVPGQRGRYFALTPDSLERKFERRIASIVGFRALAEQGLDLLAQDDSGRTERLRKIVSLYKFMERELPLLLDRWRAEQSGQNERKTQKS